MDNRRLFLWSALAALLFLNYQAWDHDFAPVAPAPTASAASPSTAAPAEHSLRDSVPSAGGAPHESVAAPPAASVASTPAPAVEPSAGALVHVRTDVLDLSINTAGAEIDEAVLRKYSLSKDKPNEFVHLLSTSGADGMALFQWGVTTGSSGSAPAPNAIYTATSTDFELKDGQQDLVVPLTWTDGSGLTITRTFHLTRGSYAIRLEQTVENTGSEPWKGRPYGQILHHWQKVDRSMFNPETYSFKGPAVFDGKKKTSLDVAKPDADQLPKGAIADGWAAALQHHFVTALVPPKDAPTEYSLAVKDGDYRLSTLGPWQTVAPGAKATFADTLWVGPKLQDKLDAVGTKLSLTVDYGKLTVIASPLFWLLAAVQKVIGNWGFTIIIVTLLIKLAFYPLAQSSGRSMARMRNIQPRMKALQERYKDNRDELGKQMMELYKREKVNPLAGCLPTLIQIPVFMGFYWVLLESVEMRQAPFLLWIQDLSLRDPYFVLPALMGATMYGQFKLNPAPADPVQAKVFAIMPLVMTGTMAFFPAGLVLYWITNTGFSILQQLRINKVVAAESQKTRN